MQILMNMISNSIKFTDSGSIGINIDWLEEYTSVEDECFDPAPFDEGVFEKGMTTFMLENSRICFNLKKSKIKKESLQKLANRRKECLRLL